jgi:uncharacterized membrane protein (DUF373 family)
MNRFIKILMYAIVGIEVLVAVALTALAIGALLALFAGVADVMLHGALLSSVQFNSIIGTVLEVFILVELFRIAIAYMRHHNVIPTVLEAALVAVARKFVVFEQGDNYMQSAIGMAVLLLAVAVSWWMLSRANACDLTE